MKGFTLLELLIVICIVTVITAIVAPMINIKSNTTVAVKSEQAEMPIEKFLTETDPDIITGRVVEKYITDSNGLRFLVVIQLLNTNERLLISVRKNDFANCFGGLDIYQKFKKVDAIFEPPVTLYDLLEK